MHPAGFESATQQASGRRPLPQAARPLESTIYFNRNIVLYFNNKCLRVEDTDFAQQTRLYTGGQLAT
jgi:hypothetical protein